MLRTLRAGASSYWFYLRLPDGYPIFHPINTGEREQLCAEASLSHHTLGGWEALSAPFSLIIPGLEPRTSSRSR